MGSPGDVWNALITKTLDPCDPESKSPKAIAAIASEIEALRSRTVWDEKHPIEYKTALERYPDAHFSALFSIVGIKNHESPDLDDWKWKGRVVLGGHNIKTAMGEKAIFTGSSSTPSTMEAARILIALKCLFPDLNLW